MTVRRGTERRHLLPTVSVYYEDDDNNNNSSSAQVAKWTKDKFSAACNIYGTINFHEVTRKSFANFIKLSPTDIEGKFDNIYKLMTEIWKVADPHLIVSVTGGAENFDIDNEVLTNFKDIIRKISQIPGAWVITGGTHTGVMKHVGDAIREESTAVCVGIPTWGIVEDRDKLSSEDPDHSRMFPYHVGAWLKAEGAYLDPNHNPFLLFDDGTDEYGGEIKFRADFEDYIVKKNKIPYILIALNGGPGTFTTICETIARGHKVILVKESGGVADIVASKIEGNNEYLESQKSFIEELQEKLEVDIDAKLEMCKEKENLFVIAQKEGEQSINDVVINAILSVDQEEGAVIPTTKYLRLALLWHNPGILTKMIPLNKPQNFIGEEKEEKSMGKKIRFTDLERLMVMALARGDVAFVKLLLLDYEVDIQDILTMDVLRTLYGYQSHEKNFPKTFAGLKDDEDYIDLSSLQEIQRKCVQEIYYWDPNYLAGSKKCILTNKAICKLRQKFIGLKKIEQPCSKGCNGNDRRWYCCVDTEDENSAVMCDPLWELFIWSSVCNLPDMAKFFWAFEGNQIAKSLIACNFWGKLAKGDRYSEQELESFRESEGEFNSLAYMLLNECYKIDEKNAAALVTTTLDLVPGETCLSMAIEFNNHDFVAHICIQNVLTDIWTGRLKLKEMLNTKDYAGLLLAIFLPILIQRKYKFHKECNSVTSDKAKAKADKAKADKGHGKEKEKLSSKIKSFYFNTPAVTFLLHFVFYILFLVIYSHVILHKRVRVPKANSTFRQNSTNMTSANATAPTVNSNSSDMHTRPFTTELLLYLFMLGHLTTELYQITHYGGKGLKEKLKSWACDAYSHNVWDIFNLLLFIIAFSLRFLAATQNVAHTLHAVNCMFWIIRLTTTLRVHPQFGQYYEMVCLMLSDLINFVILLTFMVLAYGVFSTAVLYPGWTSNQPFLSIVIKPWFHIYGEYFVDGVDDHMKATPFGTDKHNKYDEYVVWIFMGVYLCITNIVLLNIIIAVFNNTYEAVSNQGKKIWRFNRYHLMVEFLMRVSLPPPFCILQHIYLFICWGFSLCCESRCPKPRVKRFSYPVLKRDIKYLEEEEKITLSQFECDRAMYIHNCNMDFVEGKMIIKSLENDINESNVTSDGLEKNMKDMKKKIETVTEGLKQSIKEIKSKMETSTNATEGLEQNIKDIKRKIENSPNVTSEGLEATTKDILDNIQKMLEKNMQKMLEKNIQKMLEKNMQEMKCEMENLKQSVAEVNGTK